jgi:hypothetical protein
MPVKSTMRSGFDAVCRAFGRIAARRISKVQAGVLLAAYLGLTVCRVPQVLWPGRFWAEEGAYFRAAFESPTVTTFFSPAQGYYSLLNQLAVFAAARFVSIEHAPVVTGLFALGVQLLPAVLLLSSRVAGLTALWQQAAALLAILVIPPNQEVWINTITSQFHLCLAGGVILISSTERRAVQILRLSVLGLAGMTGIVTLLLLPFFVVQYARERRRWRLAEIAVLLVCGIVQGVIVSTPGIRPSAASCELLPAVLLNKQWVLPFLGSGACDRAALSLAWESLLNPLPLWLGAGALYGGLVVCLAVWGRRESMLLFAASLAVVVISFLQSGEGMTAGGAFEHLKAEGAGRYYFAPNVMLVLALLLSPGERRSTRNVRNLYRTLALVLVGLSLVVGTVDFAGSRTRHQRFFSGPNWQEEVRRARSEGRKDLAIWPAPWKVELEPARRED